ncbi:MAG: hypothetical protein F9K34_15995 [Albidovulum sp.]|uniref:I78 family peptidase inhibitor n=1 Tax=Albidovulum sp. TaxID=1872424 RepID=UPI001321BD7B|nr:I78 family peptidase inhibitor [Defluviimonas sp.]KAB2881814.1 MAG: hypothetical protein F9K34_15995 [Defluviimonas sp.]
MKFGTFALPLLLGACVAAVGTPPRGPLPGGPQAPGWIVPGPGCDRTDFDPALILGRRPEDLGLERFPFPIRVIAPGQAVTMDYSAARLNLETDGRGRITRFHCG